MTTASVSLNDLRVGDLLLLEPGEHPKLVSTVVTTLDAGECSHAVLLDTPDRGWFTISANHESDELASGVNAIALGELVADPANLRAARVLRHRGGGGAAAVEVARRYVERAVPPWPERYPGNGHDSRFGWEHIVISAFAALARHLEPGTAPRRLLMRTSHALSSAFLPADPCTATSRPVEGLIWEWDCCHFIDHCFCEAGVPLVVPESDPTERAPLATLLGCLREVGEAIGELLGRDDLPEPVPGEPAEDVEREIVRLAVHVGRRLDVGILDVLRHDGDDGPGDHVWPPFLSPRLLIECGEFDDLGWLPRGALSGR